MWEFMGNHPVASFFIIAVVVVMADNMVCNICRVISNRKNKEK